MGVSATAIVEVDEFTAAVYPPAAGTPVLAADVTAGEQALANRTLYLGRVLRDVVVANGSGVGAIDTFNTASMVLSATVIANVAAEEGDDLVIDFQCNYITSSGGAAEGRLVLYVTDDTEGTPAVYEKTASLVVQGQHGGATDNHQATMQTHHVVYRSGNTQIAVAGEVSVADGSSISIFKRYNFRILRFRRAEPPTPDPPL